MKSPDAVLLDVARRLARTWAFDAAAAIQPLAEPAWPHEFPLGQPGAAELSSSFSSLAGAARSWREWARGRDVVLREKTRRVHGSEQQLPTHLVVATADAAAELVGQGWPDRLARGRRRAAVLSSRFTQVPDLPARVRDADELSDLDFDLLCRAAEWFAEHGGAGGLTPRQVPVEGMHAKWLNTRQQLVRHLAGLTDLGLAPRHPPRLHLTYLDPEHRRVGGRWHDCASVGDRFIPPYPVEVVVISENKDTAVAFPELPGGVSVEGMGKGGSTAAAFEWLRSAPLVVYWGDLDADGLEILDGFRAAGVPAQSMLMDMSTYEQWRLWGTDVDKAGVEIRPRSPRDTPHLSTDERVLYLMLTAASCDGPRRVEQERIPLPTALFAVKSAQRRAS